MRINQGILDAERSDQGGAGFIGQNFVHTWHRARPADRMVVIDAMIYADKREPLIADRSVVFVKRDTLDADLMRRLFEEHRLTRVAHLAAESHVYRSTSRRTWPNRPVVSRSRTMVARRDQ